MNYKRNLLITLIVLVAFFQLSSAQAQNFDVTSVGELDLDSNQVVTENTVNRYFGMFVDGLGESTIRVKVGQQIFDKSYEFKLSSTRLVSYLFDNNLAEDIAIAFRRGVFGTIIVEILDANGLVNDSVNVTLDVTLPKRNCKKYTSPRLKKCTRLNLSSTSVSNHKKLARVFANSMKGPIVLEP